jgi:septum formation protein
MHTNNTPSTDTPDAQNAIKLETPNSINLDTPTFLEAITENLCTTETLTEPCPYGDTYGNIVLASSSTYRKALLSRVLDDFLCESPDIDESRNGDEPLPALAERLAIEKASKLRTKFPKHLIIGSDQVACLEVAGQAIQLCKPHTKERCFEQLMQCQGQTVMFYTGLCLLNSQTGAIQSSVECYQTQFRKLNAGQIWHYIEKEPALDCAGGFKMEGLGIALFEHIRGDDPNTLIGLPLIKLISMLKNEGVDVLS